jgi:hypothetical protein
MTARQRILAAAAVGLAMGSPAMAHHSYAAFDRKNPVTIEGALSAIDWSNPHIRLTVVTADATVYDVQWANLRRLRRDGVETNPFAIGDRLVINGAPHRDPDEHVLTLIQSVSRPADGWSWNRTFRPAGLGGGAAARGG